VADKSVPVFSRALALDRKKLAAFSALGGGFLRFPIGDRRCNRTRACVGNAGGNARPSLTNATLAASRPLHRRSPTAPILPLYNQRWSAARMATLAQSFSVNLQTNQRSFGKSSQSSQCLEADQNQDSAEAAASPARRTTRRASSSWSRLKMPSVRSAHSSWPATSGATPAFF